MRRILVGSLTGIPTIPFRIRAGLFQQFEAHRRAPRDRAARATANELLDVPWS
jgi:hypothetical protein